MDSNGGFQLEKMDGKSFLVYHYPNYHPIAQTQSLTSSNEATSHHDPLFLCPISRCSEGETSSGIWPITSSAEYIVSTDKGETTKEKNYHSLLPLFRCNNKEFDDHGGCRICHGSNFGTDYYLCVYCDKMFHKECVQSPLKFKHPYHPEHFLQLYFNGDYYECLCCRRKAFGLAYKCTICEAVIMHPVCAMKIPFIVDKAKAHDHPLTFFPRQTSLTCNVCGLLRKLNPTYVCITCNFVAHNDCMYSPRTIKISRHHHRISYISSLLSGEWFCRVCRKSIDSACGSYTCDKCGDYVVHSRCALGKDVWDGEDLEGVAEEEDDITQDPGPFDMISQGEILHFLHHHHLRFEVSVFYDENKHCQACALPIHEGNLYSCMECDFVIHETCAKDGRRIQHALHPHPLTLNDVSNNSSGPFKCNACYRYCGGFVYMCPRDGCSFSLDVRCASIVEPFDYQDHEHPLFLALLTEENPICQVCRSKSYVPLYCIECNFIVCVRCATLPYEARYRCDKHLLKILYGTKVCEKDWCEVCERNFGDTNTKVVYRCNECSSTLHIECLLGDDPYLKPGHYFLYGDRFQILRKSPASRPLCYKCKSRCHGNIYKFGCLTACSFKCAQGFFYSCMTSFFP